MTTGSPKTVGGCRVGDWFKVSAWYRLGGKDTDKVRNARRGKDYGRQLAEDQRAEAFRFFDNDQPIEDYRPAQATVDEGMTEDPLG